MSTDPKRRFAVAVAAAAVLLGGCASDPFREVDPGRFTDTVELDATPFLPQDRYQCGPAALATVLQATGVDVAPAELVPKVYLPARHGSLQPEILAAARGYERVPYVIAPTFAALLAEVAAGRPVLVLQNLGIAAWPRWHYAVVVGYSPDESEVVLRSGTDRRRVTRAGVFARTWARSHNWGMVALPPGELPAGEDESRFLSAVAGLEATGRLQAAHAAYRASLERWPDSVLGHLGLGNTAWAAGRAGEAERWYRRALALAPPDPLVLNNLATVVAAQGRCGEAGDLMKRAFSALPDDSSLRDALDETQREIDDCRTPAP